VKKVLSKVAPILTVLSFVPGLQFLAPLAAVGKGVTAVTGLTGMAANVVAGAALGGVTGGKKGAAVGALGGFAGTPGTGGAASPLQKVGQSILPGASEGTQMALSRGLVGAGSAKIMGADPLQGGITAAVTGNLADRVSGSGFVQNANPLIQQGALGAARGADMAAMTGGDPTKGAMYGAGLSAANAALNQFDPVATGTRTHHNTPPTDPATGEVAPAQLSANLTATPDFSWMLANARRSL